ncbi:MAG TPA: hypothetical protein VK993_14020, partial [Chthoniobacterales bacterium]|nr:hypothetical protein [Chthoniobacterales bacterium]
HDGLPRNVTLEVTRPASDAGEATIEPTTCEVSMKAALDVARQPEAMRRARSRILQHGLDMVGDHAIVRRLLWAPRAVAAW